MTKSDNSFDADSFARRYLDEMHDRSSDAIAYWEQLDEWGTSEPDKAWTIFVKLGTIATDAETGRIGAGPLEEFLVQNEDFAGRAAELARQNGLFKAMLSCVTIKGMSPETQRVIRAALGIDGRAGDSRRV